MEAGFLPLPLELVRALLLFFDFETLCALASTSAQLLAFVDGEKGVWKGWRERHMLTAAGATLPPASSSSALAVAPGASNAAVVHPFAALFKEKFYELDWASPPHRASLAAFYALRAELLQKRLAPLAVVGGGVRGGRGGGKQQPCLVSEYFQAYDVLVVLQAEDAIDAILQARRAAAASSSSSSSLCPLSVLLALHLLYRILKETPTHRLGGWLRILLRELAQGPFMGLAVVAFWTMGGHTLGGYRSRDVLKSERLDLRQLAHYLLLLDAQREEGEGGGGEVIVSTEKEGEEEARRHGVVVDRVLRKLESLRGIMPMVTLSPPVVYVCEVEEEGGGMGGMMVDDSGFFALSSSPPRR